jgi:SAM-dependent methyltransferase
MGQIVSDHIKQQHTVVKGEFRKQATGWGARQDNLSWTVDSLALEPDFVVLDVATGSALVASAIAPFVRRVIAADITPEMLAQARQRGIHNITCIMAAAETLPHADDYFDRVVTRYSLHHFQEPQIVLDEIYRVCRPGGAAMMIDIVAPEDPAAAQRYNHLERLRDPSHTTALSFSALQKLMTDAGFTVATTDVNPHGEMDAEAWFDLSQSSLAAREQVLSVLEQELQGGEVTGFNPFYREGRLKMRHTVSTIVGTK